MPTLSNGLSPVEQAFVHEYIASGFNGTQAYLKLRPQTSINTAAVTASDWLRNPQIQEALQTQIQQSTQSNRLTDRNYLAERTIKMVDSAEAIQEYRTAIAGIDVIAKIHRLYDRDSPDMEGYTAILQQLNVQVNVSSPQNISELPQHIDIQADQVPNNEAVEVKAIDNVDDV